MKLLNIGFGNMVNADRIIGQKAMVTEPIDNVAGTGAVSIGGTVWTARSDSAKPIAAGSVVLTTLLSIVALPLCALVVTLL